MYIWNIFPTPLLVMVVNINDAKSYMHSYLHPYFDHKRYGSKGDLIFERKTRFGKSVCICTVTGDSEMAYVKFFLGVRHDLVENTLINGFGLNEYFKNSSHTLLLPWSDVDSAGLPISIPCVRMSDIKKAAERGLAFMDEKGFDFLNHYKKLESLDRLFNDKPHISSKWARHSYLRCFRAMVMAKILDRSDFDRLMQMHRQYLESRGFSGAITAKFDATFARMKRISLN